MLVFHCYNQLCASKIASNDARCPYCGTRQLLQHGSHIYRLSGELGHGGFGRVYEAIDMVLDDRPCAIKEIIERPPNLTHKEIKREVRVLSRHAAPLPFMPDIYDYWAEGTQHY